MENQKALELNLCFLVFFADKNINLKKEKNMNKGGEEF